MKEVDKNVRVHGTFYKYRAFPDRTDAERWQRLERMLVNLEVFFAAPSMLNDPFDCYPRIELHGEAAQIDKRAKALVTEQMKRYGIQLSEDGFNQGVSNLVANIQNTEYRNGELFRVVDKGTGVYCMCRRNDSILQWAYYGGNHRGFSLEFTVPEKAGSPFDYVAEIEYVSDRERIDYFALSDDKDFLWRMVRRKFRDWEHEHEVRAFTGQPGLKRFAPEFLTGIVFGAKTSQQHQDWIRAQVAKSEAHPRYYQVSPSFTHFELQIVQL